MSVARRSATGVTIDAVAAFVTRLVRTVVARASTITRVSVPVERFTVPGRYSLATRGAGGSVKAASIHIGKPRASSDDQVLQP